MAGIYFVDVFSPVTRYFTVHFLLQTALKYDWKRTLLDFMNASLNARLKKDIFISQPEGIVKTGFENHVYILKKAFYGFRKSPRERHKHLEKKLFEIALKKKMLISHFTSSVKSEIS